jgi:hypothetical protein
MKNPIEVIVGVLPETGESPLMFVAHDGGALIHQSYTRNDLQASIAILRDLADAIEVRVRQLTN